MSVLDKRVVVVKVVVVGVLVVVMVKVLVVMVSMVVERVVMPGKAMTLPFTVVVEIMPLPFLALAAVL